MADDTKPKRAIPAWQTTYPTDGPKEVHSNEAKDESKIETKADTADTSTGEASRPEMLEEQARQFLLDPLVRDAPYARKVAFLEEKGVSKALIDEILKEGAVESQTPVEAESTTITALPAAAPPTEQPRAAPIVTYPEFLIQSKKPPPLVTMDRLIKTGYAFAGATTAIYGLSKFVVEPMVETLTEARHEFAEHTQGQLTELNTKLGENVSKKPVVVRTSKTTDHEDSMSDDSDPTDLFHRDYGTQTSPSLSRRGSSSSASGEKGSKVIAQHEERLTTLRSRVADLLSDSKDEGGELDEAEIRIKDLTQYLDGLVYPNLGYNAFNGYGQTPEANGQQSDAFKDVRNEIRSVKGVLLNARNFPRLTNSVGS